MAVRLIQMRYVSLRKGASFVIKTAISDNKRYKKHYQNSQRHIYLRKKW